MTTVPTRAPGVLETWHGAPVTTRAVLVGTFINRLGGFFQTFLILFLTARGLPEVQAGLALGAYGVGGLVGTVGGGALADRFGARAATLCSMTGNAVLLLAVLYVRDLPILLVAVALVGLAGQLFRPAAATLLTAHTPPERQVMTFALYRWALNLGTTVAPLLGGALIAVSYDLLFWVEAVTSLLFAAIALVTLPGGRGQSERSRGGYREMLLDRRYVRFLVAAGLNALVYMQYVSALPLAMRDAGLSAGWYGAVVALNGAIVIGCELALTKWTQRWPARRVVSAGFVLLGLGLSLYAVPLGPPVFALGTVVWSCAEIVGGPTLFAWPGMAAPDHLRGRYVAASQFVFALGAAVGPALGVAAYRWLGGPFWVLCGAVCAVALVLVRDALAPSSPAPSEVCSCTPSS